VNNLLNPVFRQIALKGRTKVLYKGDEVGQFVLAFEDENMQASIIRNKISHLIFELLGECGVSNHFIRQNGPKEQVVTALETLPFVVDIFTQTDADLAKRFHCQEGLKFKSYLAEVRVKDSSKEYSLISKEHLLNFEWISLEESSKIFSVSHRVMDILYGFFRAYDCTVQSVRLEFGRSYKDGVATGVLLADEMSPKNINFVFNDTLDVSGEDLYFEVAKRLGILKCE